MCTYTYDWSQVIFNIQNALILQKQHGRNIYIYNYENDMFSGYYHYYFMAIHALFQIPALAQSHVDDNEKDIIKKITG